MQSAIERREEIAERLRLRGRMRVCEIAREFHVSEKTVRTDLAILSRTYFFDVSQGRGGGVTWTEKRPAYVFSEMECAMFEDYLEKETDAEKITMLKNLLKGHTVNAGLDVNEVYAVLDGLHISQTELGKRLGKTKGAVSKYLSGKAKPPGEIATRIHSMFLEITGAAPKEVI